MLQHLPAKIIHGYLQNYTNVSSSPTLYSTTFMTILFFNTILCYPSLHCTHSSHLHYFILYYNTKVTYFNVWPIHCTLLQLDVITSGHYLLHNTAVFSPKPLHYFSMQHNSKAYHHYTTVNISWFWQKDKNTVTIHNNHSHTSGYYTSKITLYAPSHTLQPSSHYIFTTHTYESCTESQVH